MDIKTWSEQLDNALSRQGVSASERRAVLNYYNEIFQDKRSDGITEKEILKEFGFPEDVALSVAENGDYIKLNDNGAPPLYTPPDNTDKSALDNDIVIDNEDQNDSLLKDKKDSAKKDVRANKSSRGNDNFNRTEPEDVSRYNQPQYTTTFNGCMSVLLFPLTLLLGFVGSIVFIVLFCVGVSLPIAGLATLFAGFFVIAENFGAFLIAFGTGMALFAAGCMLFLCILYLAKGYWQLLKFCFGVRRVRQ